MTRAERLVRNLSAVVLCAGLVFGTVWWRTDDTWPLAQMRMFPGGPESDVVITLISADLADGSRVWLAPAVFHMKRADIEGQSQRAIRDPAMLGDLIAAYNRHVSAPHRILRLHLIRRQGFGDPHPTRYTEREIVRWPA